MNATQLVLFEPESSYAKTVDSKKESDVKTRRFKIQYGHYRDSFKRHPVLRLAGRWLSNYGFQIGDSVTLQIEKGQIHISKADSKKD
jgi:hypothetical protein